MSRHHLPTLIVALMLVLLGAMPVNAAPGGGGGPGDQPYDPCPPRTRSAPPYADKDGDGLSDCEEVNIYGTNKNLTNTDWDGLTDGEEVHVYGTNPLHHDTDGDIFSDGQEVNDFGTDPLVPDVDSDGDWFSDGAEITLGMDPANPDTDGDGLLDGEDTRCHSVTPAKGGHKYAKALSPEYDGDGLGDFYEHQVSGTNGCLADSDGDGASDSEEINAGTDPKDAGSFP